MRIIRLMSLFIMLGLMTGCTHLPRVHWGADEMRGKVVDAQTKEPIKDAVVIAIWELEGGWFQAEYTGNIALLETTTDENGNFVLDSWGPRFGMSGWQDKDTPLLIAYKKGYLFGWMHSWLDDTRFVLDPQPKFYTTDFITMEMEKYVGTEKRYPHALPNMDKYINDNNGKRCDWLKVPIFTTRMIDIDVISIKDLKFDAGRCSVSEKYVDDMIRRYSHEE